MMKFNVASINCCTETEGPYKRLAIWFQGCDIHCEGCCNPAYQPLVVRNLMTLEELLTVIGNAKELHGIEGVTYLGGEPTLQQSLPALTEAIHEMGLGVIAFTGYRYAQVQERLRGCDLVIDGAFEISKLDAKRRLIGSQNQRILHLTTRYHACTDWFYAPNTKSIEVNIGTHIFANGDKF